MGCHSDNSIKKASPKELAKLQAQFDARLTKFTVDSLRTNRTNLVNKIRPDLSYHCIKEVSVNFFYLKLNIDAEGKAQEISVVSDPNIDAPRVQKCLDEYFKDKDINFGLLRQMPDENGQVIPSVKTYTIRVF